MQRKSALLADQCTAGWFCKYSLISLNLNNDAQRQLSGIDL